MSDEEKTYRLIILTNSLMTIAEESPDMLVKQLDGHMSFIPQKPYFEFHKEFGARRFHNFQDGVELHYKSDKDTYGQGPKKIREFKDFLRKYRVLDFPIAEMHMLEMLNEEYITLCFSSQHPHVRLFKERWIKNNNYPFRVLHSRLQETAKAIKKALDLPRVQLTPLILYDTLSPEIIHNEEIIRSIRQKYATLMVMASEFRGKWSFVDFEFEE